MKKVKYRVKSECAFYRTNELIDAYVICEGDEKTLLLLPALDEDEMDCLVICEYDCVWAAYHEIHSEAYMNL